VGYLDQWLKKVVVAAPSPKVDPKLMADKKRRKGPGKSQEPTYDIPLEDKTKGKQKPKKKSKQPEQEGLKRREEEGVDFNPDTKGGEDGAPPPNTPGKNNEKNRQRKQNKKEKEEEAGESEQTRIQEIRSMSPFLFVVSSRGQAQDWANFLAQASSSVLENKGEAQKIFPMAGSPPSGALDGIHAYLVKGGHEQRLGAMAKDLKFSISPFDDKLFEVGHPFTSVKIAEDFKPEVGNNENILLEALNKTWAAVKKLPAVLKDVGGVMSALQMSNSIPLNYSRFLSKQHQKWPYHVSGMPSNAGTPGFIYILCTESEANLFLREMKNFKQPPLFYQQLAFFSDIDPDFKTIPPQTFNPQNALIVTNKQKFSENDEERGKIQQFAKDVMGSVIRLAGRLIKSRWINGDLVVNYSIDAAKAIVWGSSHGVSENRNALTEKFAEIVGTKDIQVNKDYM